MPAKIMSQLQNDDNDGSSSSYSYQMDPKDRASLQTLPGNKECIDCGSSDTEWASVSLGVFFCLECSGRHRGLGTHVSFVRSVKMDSWTKQQVDKMKHGGNQRCKDYLSKHGIDMSTTTSPKEKYDTPAAQLYQQVIKARVEGLPEPTELPKPKPKSFSTNQKMAGFGSPPPPESKPDLKKRLAVAGALTGAAVVAWSMLRNRQPITIETESATART